MHSPFPRILFRCFEVDSLQPFFGVRISHKSTAKRRVRDSYSIDAFFDCRAGVIMKIAQSPKILILDNGLFASIIQGIRLPIYDALRESIQRAILQVSL